MSAFTTHSRTVLPDDPPRSPGDKHAAAEGSSAAWRRVWRPRRPERPERPRRAQRLLGGRRGCRERPSHRMYVGFAATPCVLLLLLVAPVSTLDAPLDGLVISRVANQMPCSGTPRITIGGGRLVPQLLRGRLSEVKLRLTDMSLSGVQHASFSATLRDVNVRQSRPGTTRVGDFSAAITLGFANMPSPPGMPQPTFGRAADGSLSVTVTPTPEMSKDVKATMLAKLELHGASMSVIPHELVLFGKSIPASQAAEQTGGVRTEKLPDLPAGVAYRSVLPAPDGLHVALGGTVTTPLSELPTSVGQQTVSYTASNGRIGISTSKRIPVIGNLKLTIHAEPTLGEGTLTLVPKSVDILGSNRQPSDPIAAIVLSQIKKESLTRKLPELPSGVRYQSVSVDSAGIKVTIDGVTVQAFSGLPATVGGRAVSYGAQNGMLAVTSQGADAEHPMPITLLAKPRIDGGSLDLAPQQVQMLGATFPAADVLATIKTDITRYPLQALPVGLSYREVKVLAHGLRVAVGGRQVELARGALGTSNCWMAHSKG